MCLTRLLFNDLKIQVSLALVREPCFHMFPLDHDGLGILKTLKRMLLVNLSWLTMVVAEKKPDTCCGLHESHFRIIQIGETHC